MGYPRHPSLARAISPPGVLKGTPWPVALLVASFLCPTELSVYVADLRLPPHRIALIGLMPLALARLATRADVRLRAFDGLVLLHAVWNAIIFAAHGGEEGGFAFGGSLALESFGAYAVARAWIRDLPTFLATLRTLFLAIMAAALLALPETLLGRHFSHDILQMLTGYEHPRAIETRLGLTRAYATFDHPIHLGTFAASLLAIVWFAERGRARTGRLALIAAATFAALSSAPILCLALQAALTAWERATRGMARRITVSVAALGGLYLAASIVGTRSPIAFIATGMTLDPWTGYYRLVIWEYGTEAVWASPWIGIGLGDWARPWWMASSSVDAFWLLMAMRGGIPPLALLLASVLLIGRAAGTRGARAPSAQVRRVAKGWLISLLALILLGCTVHYWNVLHSYFFFFLGLGGWIADPRPSRVTANVLLVTREATHAGRIGAPALPGEGWHYPAGDFGARLTSFGGT